MTTKPESTPPPFTSVPHLKQLKMLFWIQGPSCHGLKLKAGALLLAVKELSQLIILKQVQPLAQSLITISQWHMALETSVETMLGTNSVSIFRNQALASKTIC